MLYGEVGDLTMPTSPPSILQCKMVSCLREAIQIGPVFLRSDAVLVFLCGANKSPEMPRTIRDELLEYARKHFTTFRFFKAEEIFEALRGDNKADLLTLEDKIADYSDCIIIICESASAFAELGAFTHSNQLVKQVLIINDRKFRDASSFITLGPVAKANKRSSFKPALYADFRSVLQSAEEIKSKLETIKRVNRQRRVLASEADFRNTRPKHRALFLADLIHLLSPTNLPEVDEVLRFLYGQCHLEIKLELALLRSFGLVNEDAGWLCYSPLENSFFYDYAYPTSLLRGLVVRFHHTTRRNRLLKSGPRL
jgi:hypothetical protein